MDHKIKVQKPVVFLYTATEHMGTESKNSVVPCKSYTSCTGSHAEKYVTLKYTKNKRHTMPMDWKSNPIKDIDSPQINMQV